MRNGLLAAALLAATFSSARAQAQPALYLIAGGDLKMLTNKDANNYFNVDDLIGPQGYGSTVGHVGIQFNRSFAVEGSINTGLYRQFEVAYDNPPFTTRRVKTDWQLTTYSITPGVTWASPYSVNMLGFRVGQANLTGHVKDVEDGVQGDYDQSAQVVDYGLLFRSSAIIVRHLSLGVEFGYDWTVFKKIDNRNGSGSYDPPQNPERNVSTTGHHGDQTEMDFSGGHIALVVGLWTSPVANSSSMHSDPSDY